MNSSNEINSCILKEIVNNTPRNQNKTQRQAYEFIHVRDENFTLQDSPQKNSTILSIPNLDSFKQKQVQMEKISQKENRPIEQMEFDLVSEDEEEEKESDSAEELDNDDYEMFAEYENHNLEKSEDSDSNTQENSENYYKFSSSGGRNVVTNFSTHKNLIESFENYSDVENENFMRKQFEISSSEDLNQKEQAKFISKQENKPRISNFNTNCIDQKQIQDQQINKSQDCFKQAFQFQLNRDVQEDMFKLKLFEQGKRLDNGSFDDIFGSDSQQLFESCNIKRLQKNNQIDMAYKEHHYNNVAFK